MAKINNTDIYPIKGGSGKTGSTAIGTDWDDGGKTKNLPISGDGQTLQDNRFRYIDFNITIGLRVPVGSYYMINREINRELNIAINEYIETNGLVVSDTELICFVVRVKHIKKTSGTAEFATYLRKYLFPNMKGKGVYESGDIDASELQLIFEETTIATKATLEHFTGYRDEVINVGDIGSVEYLDFLNNYPSSDYPNGYPLTDESKDYYFYFTSQGVEFIYYFDATNARGGYGYYGYNGDEKFERKDLLLIYKGLLDSEEDVDYKYDWVPVIEEVSINEPIWLFPPMERGEARILKIVDEKGIEQPRSSIWVGGLSGINSGNGTYVRCLSTNSGGTFEEVGSNFFVLSSGRNSAIIYYGGSVDRPKVGEVGTLYYNMDTGVIYVWNPVSEEYDGLGSAIKGRIQSRTEFIDEDEQLVVPDGYNIYIDISSTPNAIYRWNGVSYVRMGSNSLEKVTEWGFISGDIYDQYDLINLFNSKADKIHKHDYSDIINPPHIPSDIKELSDSDGLLFSGDYNDLTNKPDVIKGDIPDHYWSGTSLRFQKPDGSWGDFVDLKGEKGDSTKGMDGLNGITPHIGPNGNWWIGSNDTGVKAGRAIVQVYDDNIRGIRDGINKTFTIDDAYGPGTLKVYFNGILLSKGNNADYIEVDAGTSGNGAVINRVISSKDKLIFEFEKWG